MRIEHNSRNTLRSTYMHRQHCLFWQASLWSAGKYPHHLMRVVSELMRPLRWRLQPMEIPPVYHPHKLDYAPAKSAISGSKISLRCKRKFASVPASSTAMSLEYPTTSAANIAASLRAKSCPPKLEQYSAYNLESNIYLDLEIAANLAFIACGNLYLPSLSRLMTCLRL